MGVTHGYFRQPKSPRVRWWTLWLTGPLAWFIPALVFVAVVSAVCGFFYLPVKIEERWFWGGGTIYWMPPVPWLLGLFFSLALAMGINRFLRVRREQRAWVVLGYLENALRLNLPLTTFLTAARLSEDRGTARAIEALRERLSAGAPVGSAVEAAAPATPQAVIAELGAAESSGTLQLTMSRVMEERRMKASDTDAEERRLFLRFYVPCVLLTMLSLTVWMMIYVMPKFKVIFRDFDSDKKSPLEMPWLTRVMVDVTGWLFEGSSDVTRVAIMIVLALMPLIALLLVGSQLKRMFTPSWPALDGRWRRDFFVWHTPFLRQMVMDEGMARVCRVMADGVRAGKPLPMVLALAQMSATNRYFRKRVQGWQLGVNRGKPAAAAARAAKMPALLVGFLTAREQGKDLADAGGKGMAEMFEFVGRYYRARVERAAVMMRAVVEPVMVLLLGLLVAAVVFGMFLPLVRLIDHEAPGVSMGGPL